LNFANLITHIFVKKLNKFNKNIFFKFKIINKKVAIICNYQKRKFEFFLKKVFKQSGIELMAQNTVFIRVNKQESLSNR
jgi:hypothetical protein